MPFTRRYITWACLGLAAVLLAGCPFGAKLSVSPLSLTLGGASNTGTFRIENTGSGTLTYTVTENLPWLEILAASGGKQSGTVQGSVTNDVAFIQVVLIPANLPTTGTVRGEITIDSNGGQETVTVSAQQSAQPVLVVSRTAIDFGLTDTSEEFTITNRGNGQLQWTVAAPATDAWVSVQPLLGTLNSFGQQATVTVQVNRTGVAAKPDPYTSMISVASNGGNADVAVSMGVPGISVQPTQIDFGRTEGVKTLSLTVANNGSAALALTITAITDNGGNWLAVDNASPTLPVSGPLQIVATANANGLAPGNYTGSIRVSAPSISYSQVVPVTLSVPGFTYSPSSFNFGTILTPSQQQLTLTNQGALPISWQAMLSPGASWLSLSQSSGTLTTPQMVTVTADPTNVAPGSYSATITFTYDGGQDTVTVSMIKPKPAALKVAPQDIDFGVTRTETMVGIWNDGVGTINWSIDTTAFPAWVTLQPVNGSGIASGSVSGDMTDTVTIHVDRSLAPPNQQTYLFSFNVTATGDSTTAVPVTVRASAPQLPEFVIIGDGIDGQGIPYILLNITETDKEFIISNPGNGPLIWNVDPTVTLPSWLTSISPSQGKVDPGKQETVRVTINRSGLPRTGAVFRLPLQSNDPANPLRYIEIQVRVPFTMTIVAVPSSIAFGRFANTTVMAVANGGDAGETMRFKITSSQPTWLFVDPVYGSSIGVSTGMILDWQDISVAVDRSKILGGAGVAKLIIEAVDVPSDALPVTPVEIPVSVDIAPLTAEAAAPNMREPSLLRIDAILRNAAYQPFPSFLDDYTDTRTVYDVSNVVATIFEESQQIDTNETTILVKKNEKLAIDVLIMLDFSGSMQAAAEALVANGQLPASADPLTDAYIQCIGPMINEFPPHYRVALAVFNERRAYFEDPLRIIHGADAANPALANVDFVTNKDVLTYRLNNMDVQDNGATPLLPAILSAGLSLVGGDNSNRLIPYDTADESIIVAVTDGQRTTPPGLIPPVTDVLAGLRVRVFPIGWGLNVQANPLITMSDATGGHFYSTAYKKNADGLDIAQLSELLRWCRTDNTNPDAQSVPKDLRSHISVSWPTLNENTAVSLMEARFEVVDVTPPVTGSIYYKTVPVGNYVNDIRLGQIGMRTDGIVPGGTTSVFVYMDYAPRNLNRLTMQLNVESPDPGVTWQVVQIPTEDGGLIADWARSAAGNTLTFTAPTGRTFRYGDYGELLEVQVTGAVNPFKVRLGILDPVINFANQDSKYFTYPDTITVNNEAFRATSFPRPFFFGVIPALGMLSTPATLTVPAIVPPNLPHVFAELDIYNLGGSHVPTGVQLHWTLRPVQNILPGTQLGDVTPEVEEGYVSATETPSVLRFTPNVRYAPDINPTNTPPGVYSRAYYIDYDYGTLLISGSEGPFYIEYTVP